MTHVVRDLSIFVAAILAILAALAIAVRRLNRWLLKASVRTKVRLTPMRLFIPTKDNRNTFVTVRPNEGDRLPDYIVNQLETYVSELDANKMPRTLRLEYRDGRWMRRASRRIRRPGAHLAK